MLKLHMDGEGSQNRYPERGILNISVSSNGLVQADVVQNVQQTATEIQNEVRKMSPRKADGTATEDAAVTLWSSEGVSLTFYNEIEWSGSRSKKTEKKRYYASTPITIRFRDFEKLSEYSNTLTSREFVSVSGVSWILMPETEKEMRDKVIMDAYFDALSKAKAYATAMGLTEIRPLKLTHEHYGREGGSSGGMYPRVMYGAQQQQQQVQMPSIGGRSGGQGESTTLMHVPRQIKQEARCKVIFGIKTGNADDGDETMSETETIHV